LNAFAMVSPAYALEAWLARAMRVTSEGPVLLVIFAAILVALPAALLGGAAVVSRRVIGAPAPGVRGTVLRYAIALLPLGFGLCLAHSSFHLLTGVLTIAPVTQSAAADLVGWPVLGDPLWRWVGMRPGAVFPVQ